MNDFIPTMSKVYTAFLLSNKLCDPGMQASVGCSPDSSPFAVRCLLSSFRFPGEAFGEVQRKKEAERKQRSDFIALRGNSSYSYLIRGLSLGASQKHWDKYFKPRDDFAYEVLAAKTRAKTVNSDFPFCTSIHHGETLDSSQMLKLAKLIGDVPGFVDRIDHGISLFLPHDNSTRAVWARNALKKAAIHFDVTPTCNERLVFKEGGFGVGIPLTHITDIIRNMLQSGQSVNINTDDPGILNISLSEEFAKLSQVGFSHQELQQLRLNSIQAACLTGWERSIFQEHMLPHGVSTRQLDAQIDGQCDG
eukprot:gnl/TRDRNA2_/TRDRNA2_156697_c0_seq1.p1 gnl/TRDRNA2_/TRDRNA2_156697_c0~~gnl/TRDRNA2_/TRDRNA2_156697_c0_seq1.p1  ORF type:complete len:306 (-),score=25.96 gnl/TRDRNA2_/TRDRNA2_156697_c0_seq1:37-954(-)